MTIVGKRWLFTSSPAAGALVFGLLSLSLAADPTSGTDSAARERCDQAEKLLRAGKVREAQASAAAFLQDKTLAASRFRGRALYYHGFASFLLKDYLAAGRSLSQLAPFPDSTYGTHARYLLARIHQLDDERQEAIHHYEGAINDHARNKAAAVESLRHPERFKNDPAEKTRLEQLARGPTPEHVARALFYLGVLLYEDGRFAEALARFTAFAQLVPSSPLAGEARLRQGFCQVQLKQFTEAQRTLQPLADRDPKLADQALFWIGKAQAGSADPARPQEQTQKLKAGIQTLKQAAERCNQLARQDQSARLRHGEILAELADTHQLAGQHREAALLYTQLLAEKALPQREEELTLSLAVAHQLAGDFRKSDEVCGRFRDSFPRSVLLPAVLFRYAENAYFSMLQAEKTEAMRWSDEALKRYQAVIENYPGLPQVNLARAGLAAGYQRQGDLEKTREMLEAIPAAERTGELALVPYQLADCLIRLAPTRIDDALAAGRVEEMLRSSIELLEGFISANPNGAQTPDAMVKLGHCLQRQAAILAQPKDRQQALARARSVLDQLRQRFARSPEASQALMERARVRAMQGDVGGASNDLQRFSSDPMKNDPVAPLALLQLATLLRTQNRPAEAANVLARCRQEQEAKLARDPARSGWVPLLLLHQGIALREAGKRAEARVLLDQVVQKHPDRPESAEAALRAGQCRKEDAQQKLEQAQKQRPAGPALEAATREMKEALAYLQAQADRLNQKETQSEVRARMLYEIAWGHRQLLDLDSARTQYQALLQAFPDLAFSVEVRFELGELLSLRGDHDGAVKLLREALDREPGPELTDKIRLRLGDSLLAKGDARGALIQFNALAANSRSPHLPQAVYRAGECLLALNDNAEAAKRLARFRDEQPFKYIPDLSDRALLRLGHALDRLKQWDGSRQALETLLRRFPQSRWGAEALGRLEELKKGRT